MTPLVYYIQNMVCSFSYSCQRRETALVEKCAGRRGAVISKFFIRSCTSTSDPSPVCLHPSSVLVLVMFLAEPDDIKGSVVVPVVSLAPCLSADFTRLSREFACFDSVFDRLLCPDDMGVCSGESGFSSADVLFVAGVVAPHVSASSLFDLRLVVVSVVLPKCLGSVFSPVLSVVLGRHAGHTPNSNSQAVSCKERSQALSLSSVPDLSGCAMLDNKGTSGKLSAH